MLESIFNISLAGFIAGLIFAMPVAGPISIIIVSNALKGNRRYCNKINLGASIADFTYIFIAVYGLTRFYRFYKPAMPFLFLAGGVYLIFLGIRIIRKKSDLEQLKEKNPRTEKIMNKEKGAFYTGFLINFLNPTLLLSAFATSFFVISFVASLGLRTGGLELKIHENAEKVKSTENLKLKSLEKLPAEPYKKTARNNYVKSRKEETEYPQYFHMVASAAYASSISAGGIVWFYFLAYILSENRHRININLLSALIKGFGIILCLPGLYFVYLGLIKFI
jgi:threonine/homoserine/homoserine lactone efflux protein